MTTTTIGSIRGGSRRFATRVLSGASLLFFLTTLLLGQAKLKPKDLPPQYQEWLKITAYIITDRELDVFLHLQNDRDRDVFIQAFWNVRDPTPGTPQNEFKEEHLKRFKEANYRYKFGTSREGWMTDQARIYIILGRPVSTTRIDGSNDYYPAEIWSYYGDTEKNMPSHFQLLFYQYKNAGEYKLYNPVADGPHRLLVDWGGYAMTDYEGLYEKLLKAQPDLAMAALSIIPGDIPTGYQPSHESAIYIAAILDSPKKAVSDTYATHFLNYRGIVSTEYLTNYMKSDGEVTILYNPETGMSFCDFAMTPERLSVDLYEPKSEYSCNFLIDVSLRAGDTVVFQYSKEYPLTIPENQIKETEGMGVCIADSFPIIEGKSKLTILLRNPIGKEFSVLERDIEVLPAEGPPRLLTPAFGAKIVETKPGVHVPFQAGGFKLQADPKGIFAPAEQISFIFSVLGLTRELWNSGSIGITVKQSNSTTPVQKSFTVLLNGQPFRPATTIAQSLSAPDLPPDYYDLTLTLKDGQGRAVDEKQGHFIISPVKGLSHPSVASKAFSLGNSFILYYMLAHQYSQTGQSERADDAYRRALGLNPSYLGKIPEYADFLVKSGKPAEALDYLARIQDDTNLKFQYCLLKGQALASLGRYDEALVTLQEGNRIYNSDAGLLASLGTCYYKTGDKPQALAALRASLNLDPSQANVKALIQEIEGKK
jgi:GWxTD domain-containing protein